MFLASDTQQLPVIEQLHSAEWSGRHPSYFTDDARSATRPSRLEGPYHRRANSKSTTTINTIANHIVKFAAKPSGSVLCDDTLCARLMSRHDGPREPAGRIRGEGVCRWV